MKELISILLVLFVSQLQSQEDVLWILTSKSTQKAYTIESGCRVKIKYSLEDEKSKTVIGRVVTVRQDYLVLKNGTSIFKNDIQSIRIMPKSTNRFIVYLTIALFGLGIIFSMIAIIKALSISPKLPIWEKMAVGTLYSALIIIVLYNFNLLPGKTLKNIQEEYVINYHSKEYLAPELPQNHP